METGTIERSAIGRFAKFGDVYDATTDEFCGFSILPDNLPATVIMNTTDTTFKTKILVEKDTYEEKFTKLNVSSELQLSILTMNPDIRNTGCFLASSEVSTRKSKCSLVYSVKTKEEMLNINHEDLRYVTSDENSKNFEPGTHFVVGIAWGANYVTSYMQNCEDAEERNKIQADMLSNLRKFFHETKNDGPNHEESFQFQQSLMKIETHSDLLPQSPKTLKESFDLMAQFPKLAKTSPSFPLIYKLAPLSSIYNSMGVDSLSFSSYTELDPEFVPQIVELFDQLSLVHTMFDDYYEDLIAFNYCVTEDHQIEVQQLRLNLADAKKQFRDDMGQTIRDIRAGKQIKDNLDDVISRYHTSPQSPENLLKKFESWTLMRQKLEFAKTLKCSKVDYIGHGQDLLQNLRTNPDGTTFVLFFSKESHVLKPSEWEDNCHIFFNRIRTKRADFKFLAVDCDIHARLMPYKKHTCLKIYKSGEIHIDDVLAYQERDSNIPWIQLLSEPENIVLEPKKRGPLNIVCPCQQFNVKGKKEWHCTLCFEAMEYGDDKFVYCDCGKTPAAEIEFKCFKSNHEKFEKHEEFDLFGYLNDISPFPETNLLIVGETGVGKSTWINSFINFLTYDSLSEAEAGKLYTLIPTKFTVYNERFEAINVCTGFNENESFEEGSSSTQTSKVYCFRVGDNIIRLIDTPGIGDTRGIDKDNENFQNILETLSHLHELHGICILLKPNNAKLNVFFRFCIKQLLSNLHREASKNIVFCFTNSRATFYRPGDTMPALQKLLKEIDETKIVLTSETVYCFDSEAYRFLAAVTNEIPVTFVEDEKANFEKSWEKSIDETKRLLRYINSLTPHIFSNTINLNQARELVLNLTRPLAEISRNIHTNRVIQEEGLKDLLETNLNIEELEKQRFTTRTEIVTKPLDSPRMVCTNSDCIKLWDIGDVKTTEYVTVCHSPCKIKGITRDIVGHPRIMGCLAFFRTKGVSCDTCKHSYHEHLHTYYESVQVSKQIENQSVKEALDKNLNAAEMKQHMINERKREIERYAEERREIESASVKFACFLKYNAIAPYNDEMETYLNHLIQEERSKVAKMANPQVLHRLEKHLQSYIEERQILDNTMQQGEPGASNLTPSDIQELVDALKKLRLCGESLTKALECVKRVQTIVFQQDIVVSEKYIKRKDKNFFSWTSN